jgi:hypothetical protein
VYLRHPGCPAAQLSLTAAKDFGYIRTNWHDSCKIETMKVISLHPSRTIKATEKLIVAILTRDIDAFKATSKQFLRNNRAYRPHFSGFIA